MVYPRRQPMFTTARSTIRTLGTALMALALVACAEAGSQAPSRPGGLKTVSGNQAITISWDADEDLEYSLFWGTTPGVTESSLMIAPVSSPYAHTGLENDRRIYYRLMSKNELGRSPLSPEVSAMPRLASTSPGAPASVTAAAGDGQITLDWGPVTGATGYTIYRDTNSGVLPTIGTFFSSTHPPFINTKLANGQTYYYVVTARVGGKDSLPSAEVKATPTAGSGLPAPVNLTATAGDGQVTLSWSPVTGAASYTLYWGSQAGVTPTTGTAISGVVSGHVHAGLTNGTPHFYVVTASSTVATSPASTEASATPMAGAGLAAPAGLVATAGDTQVALSWSPVTGATSYTLYWSNVSGVTTATGTAVAGVISGYIHTGLTNGTPYYYVVTASNTGSTSAASSQASATPQAGTTTGHGSVTATLSGSAYAVVVLENMPTKQGLIQVLVYSSDPKGSPPGAPVSGLGVSASGAATGQLPAQGAGVYQNITPAWLLPGTYSFTISGIVAGTVTATVKAMPTCAITSPVANSVLKASTNLPVKWTSTSSEKAQILLQDSKGKVTYPPLTPDPKGALIPGKDIPYTGGLTILVSGVWSAKSSSAGLVAMGDGSVKVILN